MVGSDVLGVPLSQPKNVPVSPRPIDEESIILVCHLFKETDIQIGSLEEDSNSDKEINHDSDATRLTHLGVLT